MQEMIAARRSSEVKEERNDLFNALLDASAEEDKESTKLTDSELIGSHPSPVSSFFPSI
jgi:hypothetical protein